MSRALGALLALCVALLVVGPARAFTPSRPDRATLGLGARYVSTVATSNTSNTTAVLATGLECTGLAPSTTYLVRVWGRQYAAAGTTGLRWRIGDGVSDNDGSGATQLSCRDSTTGVIDATFNGAQVPGTVTYCLGTASTTSTTGNLFSGSAVWTTDATPSSVGVYFMSEVGASSVTVAAQGVIECTPIAP